VQSTPSGAGSLTQPAESAPLAAGSHRPVMHSPGGHRLSTGSLKQMPSAQRSSVQAMSSAQLRSGPGAQTPLWQLSESVQRSPSVQGVSSGRGGPSEQSPVAGIQ